MAEASTSTVELITQANLMMDDTTEQDRSNILLEHMPPEMDSSFIEVTPSYEAKPDNSHGNDAFYSPRTIYSSDDVTISCERSTLDNLQQMLESWKCLPKDEFIDNILAQTSDEHIVEGLRRSLFVKSKTIPLFPKTGPTELKTRRITKLSGETLVYKLARDCYQLFNFIHGGEAKELSDLLTLTKQNARKHTLPSTPKLPASPIVNNFLQSITVDESCSDNDTNLRAELKLLKGVMLQIARENKQYAERVSNLEKQVKSEQESRHIDIAHIHEECMRSDEQLALKIDVLTEQCLNIESDVSYMTSHHEQLSQLNERGAKLTEQVTNCEKGVYQSRKELTKSMGDVANQCSSLNKVVTCNRQSITTAVGEISIVKTRLDEISYLSHENELAAQRLGDEKSFGVKQLQNRVKFIEDNMKGDSSLTDMVYSVDEKCVSLRTRVEAIEKKSKQVKSPPQSELGIEKFVSKLGGLVETATSTIAEVASNIVNNSSDPQKFIPVVVYLCDQATQTDHSSVEQPSVAHTTSSDLPAGANNLHQNRHAMPTGNLVDPSLAAQNEMAIDQCSDARQNDDMRYVERLITDETIPKQTPIVDELSQSNRTPHKPIPAYIARTHSPPFPNVSDGFTGVSRYQTDRYFLSEIRDSTSEEAIRTFLKERGITVTFFKFFKSYKEGVVSARINVLRDGRKLTVPGFWPPGVGCRNWMGQAAYDAKRQMPREQSVSHRRDTLV